MQVIPILDAEDKPDRHSSVHALILVVDCPNNSSKEVEDDMALNKGNKGLRKLLAGRNTGSTSKEVPKSKLPSTLPPFPPLPLTDLRLHTNLNLKKRRPVQEL